MRVDSLARRAALIAAGALAGGLLAGCGGSGGGIGASCDDVLDCAAGTACIDGTCQVPDRDGAPDADAAADGAVDAPAADAGPAPDGDLGLQTDAGYGATGCMLPPYIGPIAPVDEWSFPPVPCSGTCGSPGCTPIAGDPFPNHLQAVATPTVANLTDDDGDGAVTMDDVPDIVLMTYNSSNIATGGVIRILSGRPDATGLPIVHRTIPIQDPADPCYTAADAAIRHDSSTSVAIGDLDGDGDPELVALTEGGPAVAWTPEGCRLWTATEPNGGNDGNAGAPTIADLEGDGFGEVAIGRVLLDHDGAVRWIGNGDLGYSVFGVHSIVANVDLLGAQEVIAGSTVYGSDGSIRCRNTTAGEGLNATGNFDADPEAEIVVVRNGRVSLLEDDCTLIWQFLVGNAITTVASDAGGVGLACAGSGGGEPTIADFDGDGEPEIALANSNCYVVIDTDGSLLWASRTEDDSSQGTGSSVFDFNGDGVSEVIYNDEHHIRIYDGPDGTILWSRLNSSRTRHENPVVADVDNDGNAELVFIENNEASFACLPGVPGGAGLHILGDDPAIDAWVPTRRIWNQHSYHITNINENGTLPRPETQNWTVPGYNNFRTNLPDFSVLAAPDLVAEFVDFIGECLSSPATGTVTARVCNRGDVRVGPGAPVAFRVDGALQVVVATTQTLDPGECEIVVAVVQVPDPPATFTLSITADDDGAGGGVNRECDETNNADTEADLTCDFVP